MGAENNSTTLERQTGENNEVNDVSVLEFPTDAAGNEKQAILL